MKLLRLSITINFTKENNISQLGDYDLPFCEQQYTHGSYYISLLKFKSFDQLIPLKLQLHDAIYRLRFYSNTLIHILLLSNSHNNVASIQKNQGDKSRGVIVALNCLKF